MKEKGSSQTSKLRLEPKWKGEFNFIFYINQFSVQFSSNIYLRYSAFRYCATSTPEYWVEWHMMMMMMSCFCGMVDRRTAFSFISSHDHCQRPSPSRISDTPRAGFEPHRTEFRFSWIKLCSSDDHYTTAPRKGIKCLALFGSSLSNSMYQ